MTKLKELPIYPEAKLVANELLDFLTASPTAWQAVARAEKELQAAGFVRYEQAEELHLKTGDKGYFVQNSSALFAFRIGQDPLKQGFRIFGAHSDSPALKLKPQVISASEGVNRLAVEVYGGPLLNTFFDRPLSLAGRVSLRSDDPLKPHERLVDFKKALLILPNLAIHMGNTSNDGLKIERQKDILPFISLQGDEEEVDHDLLRKLLAEELDVDADAILDYELLTYEAAPPSFCGLDDCFISAGRLDNLSMFKAGLDALIHNGQAEDPGNGIKVLLVTDNEEVGSRTKQGAAGLFARDLLERLTLALGADRADFLASFANSFMISADLAHAVHPNYPEKADPGHRPRLNQGPVIKQAASQSYSSDAYSSSVFRQLAAAADVPCQTFVNRSDLRGGSTIGPISSALMPMPTVDCGNPIWGMHSIRETGGVLDPYYMEKLVSYFYSL